jgi:MATE family multidrug resistance protein
LYYGIPNGLMMFLEAGLFNVLLLIIGQMGKVELAATNLAFTLNTLAFIPIFGLQTAVIVLVGQRIGEKRPDIAAKTTGRAILVSNVYMSIWASLYVIFPDLVLQIFAWHSDPEEFRTTRELSLILLRFVAAYTIFDGWQLIYGGAVRGAGDTRVSLLFFIGSQLMVMVLPVWVGWRFYGQGILFAWTWLTLWVVVLAAGFYLRFHAGHWRSMNVIEPVVLDDDDATDDARPALSQERVPV